MNKIIALILSLGLILSSLILSWGMTKIRPSTNYVTVKGLAEREVTADRAWFSLNTTINANSTEEMQTNLAWVEKEMKGFLYRQGFTDEELNSPSMNVYQNNYKDARNKLNADYKLSVSTTDISKIKRAMKSTGDLISKGIFIQSEKWSAGPKYYFTKFKEVKKEMLAEATREAKAAAQEFANNSGSDVGKIRRANQGIFQILPNDGTNEDEVFYPKKIIRVVSTVDYFLD